MQDAEFDALVIALSKESQRHFAGERTGHDFPHHNRVFNTSMRLQKSEGGDKIVIASTALLHDFHRLLHKKGWPACNPKDSLPRVARILRRLNVPKEKIELILHCVEFHSSGFSPPTGAKKNIELAVIQDADMLDMLGGVGVARAFVYAGAHGYPIWTPEVPIDGQVFDGKKPAPSEIHYFYMHILHLAKRMNTKSAKVIAKKRCKTTKSFLDAFLKEASGED
jgi:uncharacterized protein